MENNSSSTPQTLEERVATLEDYVTKISGTLYDLIARLRGIGPPPCPPMCKPTAAMAKQTTEK